MAAVQRAGLHKKEHHHGTEVHHGGIGGGCRFLKIHGTGARSQRERQQRDFPGQAAADHEMKAFPQQQKEQLR